MFQTYLLVPMCLTVALEVPIFYLCGYKKLSWCIWFALVNIMSNLLLNEFLSYFDIEKIYDLLILGSECVVILLEFILCSYVVRKNWSKLLRTICLTNITSYLAGVVLFFL